MVELINREMEEDQRYWNLNHLINKVEPEPSNQHGISKTIILEFLHIRDVP